MNRNRKPAVEAYDVTGGETKAGASSFYGRSFLCIGPHKCEKTYMQVFYMEVCRQFVASAAGESGHMANGKTESMNSRKEERKCTNRFLPA